MNNMLKIIVLLLGLSLPIGGVQASSYVVCTHYPYYECFRCHPVNYYPYRYCRQIYQGYYPGSSLYPYYGYYPYYGSYYHTRYYNNVHVSQPAPSTVAVPPGHIGAPPPEHMGGPPPGHMGPPPGHMGGPPGGHGGGKH